MRTQSVSAAYREASNRETKRRLYGRAEGLVHYCGLTRDGHTIRYVIGLLLENGADKWSDRRFYAWLMQLKPGDLKP